MSGDARLDDYAVGEEVVVRPNEPCFSLDRSLTLPARSVPAWTIGVIRARQLAQRGHQYLVSFSVRDEQCITFVRSSSIEGVA